MEYASKLKVFNKNDFSFSLFTPKKHHHRKDNLSCVQTATHTHLKFRLKIIILKRTDYQPDYKILSVLS